MIHLATNDLLGLDQSLLGPEAAVAMVRPWGVVGVLVSHQWDVTGRGGSGFSTGIMSNHWTILDPISRFGSSSHLWSNCPGEPGVDGGEYEIA